MSEGWLEAKGCRYAIATGWLVRKVKYIGRDAAPDRWFLKNGRWKIIELKDYGEKPTPQQLLEMQRLKDAGADVHWVDNFEDFVRALES